MNPVLYNDFASGHVRKLRLFRWTWTVRDGLAGPVLAQGTRRTERGAHRAKQNIMTAAKRRTWTTASDHLVLHPLSPVEALAICDDLAAEQIRITIRVTDWVHLYPAGPVDTADEVHALTVVKARTDARVDWHKATA